MSKKPSVVTGRPTKTMQQGAAAHRGVAEDPRGKTALFARTVTPPAGLGNAVALNVGGGAKSFASGAMRSPQMQRPGGGRGLAAKCIKLALRPRPAATLAILPALRGLAT